MTSSDSDAALLTLFSTFERRFDEISVIINQNALLGTEFCEHQDRMAFLDGHVSEYV